MGRLLVPRAVLLPVARRDLLPRVVKVDGLLEVLHAEVVCRWLRSAIFFSWGYARADGAARVRSRGCEDGDVNLTRSDGIDVGVKWVYGGLEDVKGRKRRGRAVKPGSRPCAINDRRGRRDERGQRFFTAEASFLARSANVSRQLCAVSKQREKKKSAVDTDGHESCASGAAEKRSRGRRPFCPTRCRSMGKIFATGRGG